MSVNGIGNNIYAKPYEQYELKTYAQNNADNPIFSAQGQVDTFEKTAQNYQENEAIDTTSLKQDLEKTKSEQGVFGKLWDGFKNLTGIGASSSKAEQAIEDYENGLISQEEMHKAVDGYKEGQKTAVDVVADMASGIISIVAFGAATALMGPAGALLVAGATGMASKVGIKAGDAALGGREYTSKDLLYDGVTGGINGLLGPVTNGIGNTVTKTIATKFGLTVLKEGAEEATEQGIKQGVKQFAKNIVLNQTDDFIGGTLKQRAVALGAGMATDGALGGASDNMVRAALEGENVLKAGAEGFVGGLVMSPVIGGGMKLAGKAGKVLNNKITTSSVLPDGLNTNFRQGTTGDCALLSTIDGMMANPNTASKIKNSITRTAFGDYDVKIGDRVVRVAKESLNDEILSDTTGIKLFEAAYKQTGGSIDGEFAEVTAKQFGLNPIHITSESITDELLERISKDSDNLVLSLGMDGHYYSIQGIDPQTKMITLADPYDTSKTLEMSFDDVKTKAASIDGGSVKETDLPNAERSADEIGLYGKTQVDDIVAARAAAKVTDDPKLQSALIRMAKEEAIVIRTKEDAIPVLQRLYNELADKRNVIVLDINPQDNNGMPKSNSLISGWFLETNNMADEQLITLTNRELSNPKLLQVRDICSEWQPKDPIHKKIQKQMQKLQQNPQNNPLSVQQAREIMQNCATLSPDEILQTYSEENLAQALAKINSSVITTVSKNGGYAAALAEQVKDVIGRANGEPITLVIPDDCSLSGSSILCDTVKILDLLFKRNNIETDINIVFAPMILGDEAQKVVSQFNNSDLPIDDTFLRKINALRADGKESFKGAREAFERIRSQKNVTIQLSGESIKATHFTQTETFRQIGEENPALQQQLLYLMQGPIDGNNALFGGFGQCGVMVVTPTNEFQIGDRIYAGKIPTNSVGFMEVLGQECGVLNDSIPTDSKGVFTKGTGVKYTRYCEWNGLSHPTVEADRIPILIKNGTVQLKLA